MTSEAKSKTPKFDTLLDGVLEKLWPHERECAQRDISKYCEVKFEITKDDIEFYKLLRVPPPQCCPTCRRQKRFAFVNRLSFYKRKNNAPGATETILSYVPPLSPFIVYDLEYYRSTKWDPTTYGTQYDESLTFFDQFYDFILKVPQSAIVRDPSSVNSEYSLNGRNLKNGYLVSGGFNSENIWYSIFLNGSREIMDSQNITKCEQCYEIVQGKHLNLCTFCYFSNDCISSHFLFDCQNCQDCLGCVNLRNKKYCFFNKQLSKDEYDEKVRALNLESHSGLKKTKELFWEFVKSQPIRASRCQQAVNSSGVLIINSKNCHHATSCERSEHERYVDTVIGHRDSMDVSVSGGSELLYETSSVGSVSANIKFSSNSKFITDSEFLINCRNCQYCFACISLENKSYHIFNRPYEPDEYFKKLDKIKSALLIKDEYGEFFPYKMSRFAYNGSEVDYVYPLNEQEINKLGALYQPDVETDTQDMQVLNSKDIPNFIDDVTDDILDKAIICEETGRPFRIIKSELEFYRKFKLPIPTVNPFQRMRNRFKHIGNHHIYNGTCEKCGKKIETIYESGHDWRLYCEECYKKEVY